MFYGMTSQMDLPRSNIASNSGSSVLEASGTSQSSEEAPSSSNIILFREIHKNAWLRKLPSLEKRSGAVPKKGERVWTVFCVHDDVQPFLELYFDQKMAVAHKPDWCVSLTSTLHVSPTIVAQDQEYEFVITLPSDVVRLTAPSWDAMMEWVDTIRSKLRELRILCPRENMYSRMPEPRLPLLPTRDPNSPLPPPPLGPSALVPGMEPVHLEGAVLSASIPVGGSTSPVNIENFRGSAGEQIPGSSGPSSTALEVSSPLASHSRQRLRSSSLSETHSSDSAHPQSSGRGISSSQSPSSISSSLLNSRYTNSCRPPASPGLNRAIASPVLSSSTTSAPVISASVQVASVPSVPCSSRLVQSPSVPSASFQDAGQSGLGSQNVTIIEVADSHPAPCDIFNFNFVRDAIPQTESTEDSQEQFFTPPATPLSRASISQASNSDSVTAVSPPPLRIWQQITQVVTSLIGQPSNIVTSSPQSEVIRVTQGVTNITIPSQELNRDVQPNNSVYEHVYPVGGSELNAAGSEEDQQIITQQPPSNVARSGNAELHHRRRRTSSGSGIVSPRSRRATSTNSPRDQPVSESERRLHPTPHSLQQGVLGVELVNSGSARVTLRDQQVQQLRKEMLHPGGVRLQVRRKDCTNSIAFIDAFGAVWVAGWKQREHPMLYNALHIGDQLLSTAGLAVQSAADAHRFIRASTSLYVPFVIRRVPFGRVFAFRRDTEGQSLGITLEGGTAEIRDVAPHSPAARGGLAPRAPSCDGLTLTSWVITEINGRPLNLFFKDGEVRDRLNAVGKEISVLVQPFDLIKQIRKQLKTLRSYKDYIVQ